MSGHRKPFIGNNALLLPAHVALVIHALQHGRTAMAVLGFVGTVVAAWLPAREVRGNALARAHGIAGAVAGVIASFVSAPPPGPFPAPVLSGLCGTAVGLMVYGAYTGHPTFMRVSAWVLVALSSNVDATLDAFVLGICMGVAEVLTIFTHSRAWRHGLHAYVQLLLTVLLMAPLTWGIVAFVQFNEGVLMSAAARFIQGTGLVGGLGLESTVRLSASSSVVPRERALLEVTGPSTRLRAVVLDVFDGSTWSRSAELDRQQVTWPTPGETMEAVLFPLEDLAGGFLPVPAGTVSVTGADAVITGGHVVRGTLLSGMPVKLSVDAQARLPSESLLATYLEVPDALRADLHALALPIVKGAATPMEKARAVEAHFHEGFEYALDTQLQGNGHPLVVLVRERRAAYCTYFAAVTVLMLRTLGIPARFVGGFMAEERTALGDRAVVRERDAHAWVEAWDAASGRFVTLEPTPWRGMAEALGRSTEPNVLSRLAATIRSLLLRAWLRVKASPADAALDLLLSPVGVLLVGAFAWVLWRNRVRGTRVVRHAGAVDSRDPELREAHRAFVAAVVAAGVPGPRDAESDEELVARIPVERAPLADAARAFVQGYQRARWGGGKRTELRGLLANVKAAGMPPTTGDVT